jgi:DNA transformation protein and related proteins
MDADDIIELFAAFGRVSVRRMFGGFGIYAEGVMFALASRGVIYLKADDDTAAAFRAEGAGPFTYDTKHGRHASLSYWRLPDRLYDDPDELAAWSPYRADGGASRQDTEARVQEAWSQGQGRVAPCPRGQLVGAP